MSTKQELRLIIGTFQQVTQCNTVIMSFSFNIIFTNNKDVMTMSSMSLAEKHSVSSTEIYNASKFYE